MSRAVLALAVILFLLSASSMAGSIQTVKAAGETILINADGSISPPNAPIYTADNITYTLTGNITVANANGIVIERNNTVLNGAGYTVTGSGNGYGIALGNMDNVTVTNMRTTNFTWGILLSSSSGNTLSANTLANNAEGIQLQSSSSNNTLSGNNVTANGNHGILLEASSDNNTLSDNNVAHNYFGIWLWGSSNCTLSGNNVTANSDNGIWLDSSSNNTLSGNTFANNYNGIWLDIHSDNNTLYGNNVTANNEYGIWLDYDSSYNEIYHNNFNNTGQVYSSNSTNIWDNGSSGNYWSDYRTRYPNATQVGSSGVWNTSYAIDQNNTDRYPLMAPYAIPEFPSFLILPLFFIATLLAVTALRRKRSS